MTVDLKNYFSEDIANDLQKRLVIKIIVGSKAKNKTKLKECITSLQVDMFLDDMGVDWFDYGFVNWGSGKISLSFYKIMPDKSKKHIDVTIDEHDAVSRDTKHILGIIRTARNHIGGGWA